MSDQVPEPGLADVLLAVLSPQLLGVPDDELEEAIRAALHSIVDETEESGGHVRPPAWDSRLLLVSAN